MRSVKKTDLRFIRHKAFFLPVLLCAVSAYASTVTSTIPAGSTTSGPVAASATFTTGYNFLSITLTDLEGNPNDVGQLISGLSFTLSNGVTSGTLFQSMGTRITVNSGGAYSTSLSGAAGWGLNNNVSGGLQLSGPAGLIIGAPGAGGTYSNANSSITGTSFLSQTVTFSIIFDSSANIAPNTTVTSASFSFGTTPGQFTVKGCMSNDPSCGLSASRGLTPSPEPISLILTGTGLVGLLFIRRRRA